VRLADLAPAREIHLEKLTLRHAGASQDVLHGLDLRIPAGQRLAVVGRNGAGKTTLATVLAGLRKPTEGRLFVDGVDLATVDTSSWQRRVAVLSQDFVHYPLTAYDNVGLGCPELLSDRDAVLGAAELAGATGVIAAIPGGWDSVLDPTLAGGTDLSGGQWQRIGLARALLAVAGGARVLVLDEPTSALDVRAEAALFAELITMPALRGVTVILISHRFGSVRQAERIVVLDDGRVCEDGTHSELVDAGGLYASLFSSQAELFREPCDPGGPAAVGEVALDA
jgi:ATP-binding cassette subfamily B protein